MMISKPKSRLRSGHPFWAWTVWSYRFLAGWTNSQIALPTWEILKNLDPIRADETKRLCALNYHIFFRRMCTDAE